MIDYNEVGTGDPNEVFLPKVGETAIVHIVTMERVDEPNGAKNFKSQNENYGFHYKINLAEGKHSILNVFALLECFKEQNVQDGDTIEIDHFGKGKYKVTKVEASAGAAPSATVGQA